MKAPPRSTCRDAASGARSRAGRGAFPGFLAPGRLVARHHGQACKDGRRGAVIVETSIVISLFFLFALAMIEMARMGMANQLLTDAAREGARVAVIPRSNPTTDVTTTVQNLLNSGGIPPSAYTLTITPTTINSTTTPLGTPITVSVSTAFSNISWLAKPLYLGSVTLSSSSTLSSEYP
jgi:Flp pilus assembly protein TadG